MYMYWDGNYSHNVLRQEVHKLHHLHVYIFIHKIFSFDLPLFRQYWSRLEQTRRKVHYGEWANSIMTLKWDHKNFIIIIKVKHTVSKFWPWIALNGHMLLNILRNLKYVQRKIIIFIYKEIKFVMIVLKESNLKV